MNFNVNDDDIADQLTNFVNRTQDVPVAPVTDEAGQDLPRVPFPSGYRLTGSQEQALLDHAARRLKELEDELGRGCTGDVNWFESTDFAASGRRSFMGKRQLYEMTYHNHVEWRPSLLGGVFEDSNLVVPLARRIARQMVARANNYFFGTDPWFAVYPVGVADRELAADIERYTRFKFEQSRQKHVLELAVELAFVRGEAVVKTTFESREQLYQEVASVLVDERGGDILGADGDYIMEDDLWVVETAEEGQEGAAGPEQHAGQAGVAAPVSSSAAAIDAVSATGRKDLRSAQPGKAGMTGRMVLKRDGVTLKPRVLRYDRKMITRKLVHFKGAEPAIVYYKDFLCPLAASSIQEADCVVHLYDMPVMRLADMYQRRGMLEQSNEEAFEATQRAVELIRTMAFESGEPKAAKNQYRPEMGETATGGGGSGGSEQKEPVVEIAEFHLRYDANGDGIMEDTMLVMDRRNGVPIFYDYEANVTPDGLRPFDVVKVNEVDGRWHGVGAMEMFENSQEIVDLLVNRWNFSQSRAGRVDFWNPHNTMEGDLNRHLELNWGGTYTPKPGKRKEDILDYVTLPDMKHEMLKNMIEFFMQVATNESGVANANDARAAGLNTSELATGVRNIEKSGQEMFALYLSHLEPGLQGVVQRAMRLTFANLDQEEVFTFFEGDVQSLGVIKPRDVKGLELNVSLLLTRYRGEQLLQSSMQAAQLVTQYYAYSPEIQARVAPLYRDMLKALQINFADEIIVAMPPAPPGGGGVPGGAGAPGAGGGGGAPGGGGGGVPKVNARQALEAAQPKPATGQSPVNL